MEPTETIIASKPKQRVWIPERVYAPGGTLRFQRQGDTDYWTDLENGTQVGSRTVTDYIAYSPGCTKPDGYWKGINTVNIRCHDEIFNVDVWRDDNRMHTYHLYTHHNRSPEFIARRFRRAMALQGMLMQLEFKVDVWTA